MAKKAIKIYPKGYKFYKSSNCPTCPVCEEEQKSVPGFLATLSAPARRALKNKGITTMQKLSEHTENEILGLHGMGRASLPKLCEALQGEGLEFKTKMGG